MGLRRRITTAAAATAASAGLALGLASPATALSQDEANAVVTALKTTYNDPTGPADNNPYDFDILYKLVEDTGAAGVLATLDKFTLFAPNDRAFEVTANNLGLLGKGYRYSAKVDEKRVYEALKPLDNAVITEVLLYHVIPNAKVTGKQVLSGPFTQRVQMANKENLRVTVLSRSAKFPVIVLGDKDGRAFNDLVVRPDVIATENTVVHSVSDVLLPDLKN